MADKTQVKKLFDQADTSGDGGLTKVELAKFVARIEGHECTPDDIASYWMRNNIDGDNKISFDEFYAVFNKKDKKCVKKADVEAHFRKFDKDGSGTISADEATYAMCQVEGFSAAQADEYVKKCDVNGDGNISLDEFLKDFYNN